MLNALEIKAERRAVGRVDGFDEHAKRPLAEQLADYAAYLKAKGDTAEHVANTLARLKAIFDGCGFKRLPEITASKIANWLATERTAGRLGAQTSNYYMTAGRGFCTWLVQDGRWPKNPLAELKRMNAETDVRRERRILSAAEFGRLVNAVRWEQRA